MVSEYFRRDIISYKILKIIILYVKIKFDDTPFTGRTHFLVPQHFMNSYIERTFCICHVKNVQTERTIFLS